MWTWFTLWLSFAEVLVDDLTPELGISVEEAATLTSFVDVAVVTTAAVASTTAAVGAITTATATATATVTTT